MPAPPELLSPAATPMLAAMEARGIATAWLTLDRADNDVSRFLDCLAEAVQRLGVEDPRGNGGSNPFDAVAALAAHESPFTLFLDDFERVQEPAVLGLVREIVEHLPRRGQIVIGSRSLPDLGLGRLRARGQLLEIDTDRLRFSLEETTAFFALRTTHALPGPGFADAAQPGGLRASESIFQARAAALTPCVSPSAAARARRGKASWRAGVRGASSEATNARRCLFSRREAAPRGAGATTPDRTGLR